MSETAVSRKLTNRQIRFVEEFLIDLNATQAAIRAGYKPTAARTSGPEIMLNPAVATEIAKRQAELSQRTEITADNVLKRWWHIATADPNALVQHRRAPCRHCNGTDNQYQWRTRHEYAQACTPIKRRNAATEKNKEPLPSKTGGFGYSYKSPINPNCPECHGDGIGYVYVADTRTLSADQKILYAGAKETKDGIEIKMQDQGKALENVARHLGMLVGKMEVTGKLTLEALVASAMEEPEAVPTIEGAAEDDEVWPGAEKHGKTL
jgi:phage terminase small subunit